MEIYELRYFLGVAKYENIHRASEKLGVSTASLSKAVARLESELGVALFYRERRAIRLSDQGRLLQRRAAELVQLEENTRYEVAGHPGTLHVVLTGPEVLLAKAGTALGLRIKGKFPTTEFEFHADREEDALAQVENGNAHIALITGDAGPGRGLTLKMIEEAKFQTYVGFKHPLYPAARQKRAVPVEELLKHAFASPDRPLLGQVGARQSVDGWRDDQFPRKIEYRTSSLKILEELVTRSLAVAYLPDYFAVTLPLAQLKVSGCPYSCVQKIKMAARRPKDVGWLNQFF